MYKVRIKQTVEVVRIDRGLGMDRVHCHAGELIEAHRLNETDMNIQLIHETPFRHIELHIPKDKLEILN